MLWIADEKWVGPTWLSWIITTDGHRCENVIKILFPFLALHHKPAALLYYDLSYCGTYHIVSILIYPLKCDEFCVMDNH